MKFKIPTRALGNPRVTFSRLGYHASPNGSFERRLGGSTFPRFHVYIKTQQHEAVVDIHLDHKAHTYDGFRAHQAEHDSDIVIAEVKRLQQTFST